MNLDSLIVSTSVEAHTEMFDFQYHSALFWLTVHNVRMLLIL